MNQLRHVSKGILIAFFSVALATTYWSALRGPSLLERPDNPRAILVEREINRGRILDTNGFLLAETTTTYDGEALRRLYPYPEAAPATGYYSLRYGTAGIEATYDSVLSGELGPSPFEVWQRDLRHDPIIGGDVQLTLDLLVQRATTEAITPYNGAAIVVTIPDGAVRAIASLPSFNPNTLEQDWARLVQSQDAPLLNRITQGVYQPGAALQTVLMAHLLSQRVSTDQIFAAGTEPISVNSLILTCGQLPRRESLTLPEAYIYACPQPFTQLLGTLTPESLDAAFWKYGLLTPPELRGLNTDIADSPLPLALQSDDTEALIAGITGQSNLAVSPLQMMMLLSAIANDGNAPLLHIVQNIRLAGSESWEVVPLVGLSRALLTAENAALLRDLMTLSAEEGVAAPARTVSEYPIIGHAGTAFTGLDAHPLQWFLGMIRSDSGEAVAVVVVLEGAPDSAAAATAGGRMLDTAARLYLPE
ncbi:MAG: penicillin-binding protein 2 [Anaerolineae bacterium]